MLPPPLVEATTATPRAEIAAAQAGKTNKGVDNCRSLLIVRAAASQPAKNRDAGLARASFATPTPTPTPTLPLRLLFPAHGCDSMSGISAILRGDCWTELMLTAFAAGRDGSQLQKPYAGLSVKTADGAADLVFRTVEAGTVQQDKLVIQNSGSGTATLRGLRCVPERSDGAISIICELPEGGALMPAGSSYQVEVHSTAPSVVGLHYTFVLALLEVEEHTDRALVSSRVLVGARACLMVTDPEGMAALNPEASTRSRLNHRGAAWRSPARSNAQTLSSKLTPPPSPHAGACVLAGAAAGAVVHVVLPEPENRGTTVERAAVEARARARAAPRP